MHATIRKIGNSRGIVIPKPLLIEAGLEHAVDISIENGVIMLRKPVNTARQGWAEAAQALAQRGEDQLVMGEFANDNDADLVW